MRQLTKSPIQKSFDGLTVKMSMCICVHCLHVTRFVIVRLSSSTQMYWTVLINIGQWIFFFFLYRSIYVSIDKQFEQKIPKLKKPSRLYFINWTYLLLHKLINRNEKKKTSRNKDTNLRKLFSVCLFLIVSCRQCSMKNLDWRWQSYELLTKISWNFHI